MAATYVRRVNRYKDKSKISLEQFNNYVSILRDEGPDAVKEQVSVWLILVSTFENGCERLARCANPSETVISNFQNVLAQVI